MRRRDLVQLGIVLVGWKIATPNSAFAEAPRRFPRIGVLAIGSLREPPLVGLIQGLSDLGYVDGRTIAIEHPNAAGNYQSLQALAAELASSRIDLLVTFGGTATRAANAATRKTPIVMIMGADPVRLGLVQSLSHPGTNITGVITLNQQLAGKRVEHMKEIVPGLTRIAVLFDPASSTESLSVEATKSAAASLGIAVVSVEARGPAGLEAAFAVAVQQRVEGLITVSSTMLLENHMAVAALAARHRVPAIYFDRSFVEAGGLMAYGPNFKAMFYRAASLVDRILKGAMPGDLPVEQASKFDLVINLKTATALGLTIPPALLARADEVIE